MDAKAFMDDLMKMKGEREEEKDQMERTEQWSDFDYLEGCCETLGVVIFKLAERMATK